MACQAAMRCLNHARVDKSCVDLIVVACSSPDQIQPAVACLVQAKLGLAGGRCPAFDVNSVCTGFVFALSTAQGMMHDAPEQFRHALVIGTDAYSKILNWEDRRTCVYFGDGAGAVLLSQSERNTRRMRFRLGSDGRGSRCIGVPAGGTSIPVDHEVIDKKLHKFTMDGPLVWDFAVSTVPRAILQLLSEHNIAAQEVDLFILHQSNLRMIESIMRDLGLPMEKTVTTLETYGNTAAASIPITLAKAVDTGRLQSANRVVFCGFGGGLSWGVALLEW
jgi:3-oxoacyl-[acyl-carrier-protein] synthase-3